MNVKNCRKCGAIFNYLTGPQVCQQCRARMEEKFQEVKKYVYENKGATVPQIAEACSVEVSQLHTWIREERLEFADDSPIRIGCEQCGTMIQTGRFCAKCKNAMVTTLTGVLPRRTEPVHDEPAKGKEPAKMRFL